MSRPVSGKHINNPDRPTSEHDIPVPVASNDTPVEPNEDISFFGSCKFEPRKASKKMWERMHTWRFWKIILLGQFLALTICGTAVTSQVLQSKHGVDAPTAQGFLNYLALAVVYMPFFVFRPKRLHNILRWRSLGYFLVALADVEANYLLVKAYQYTTLTSVQLLDCITIPAVMILSRIFLKVHYRIVHIAGVIVCMSGVGALIAADAQNNHSPGQNPILGDMYALIGATLYAVTNVAEEYSVKFYTRLEFLGLIGFFGSFIGGVQLIILERQQLVLAEWNSEIIGLFIAFGICMFLLYSLAPVYMRFSSATTFNLSILTADFYVFIFGLALFRFKFSPLYIVSFCLVVVGITVYHYKDPVIKTVYPKLVKKDKNAKTSASGKSLPPPTLPSVTSFDSAAAADKPTTTRSPQLKFSTRAKDDDYGTAV